MGEERTQRRLAAILAADVVGYGILMQRDEVGTLAALKTRRRHILEPRVAQYQGRVFKIAGDGVLVEFSSAVNAVQCAVDLQQAFAEANADLPERQRIVLRVGVHVGDVMVEGADLYGDGVNLAARLEGAAEPGGVLVSEDVHRQVKSKLPLAFEDLGPQALKHVAEPIRVLRVLAAGAPAKTVTHVPGEKPTIAVLPFANMSGDAEQEYFSDGITEDIISELSRFRSLFVIARNSSFQYKGRNVDVRRVARELGAQYLLEGSVRKHGDRVRVTAQFVDTATGNHLWSEKYDRPLQDIFSLQDELVHAIAVTLEGQLAATIAQKARAKPTADLRAYELVLQARAILDMQSAPPAIELLERAVALDPNYAYAYGWLSLANVVHFFSDSQDVFLERARDFGKQAIALDDSDGFSQVCLGTAYLFLRDFERAGSHFEWGYRINSFDAQIAIHYCHWLTRSGRHIEALALLDRILLQDPFPSDPYFEIRMITELALGDYEAMIKSVQRTREWRPWQYAYLAAACTKLGRVEEARKYVDETLRARPDFSIGWLLKQEPFKLPADRENLTALMSAAGFAG